jgi:tetratricopeptide (TPR) repeat protein
MAKARIAVGLLLASLAWGQAAGKPNPAKPAPFPESKLPDFATWYNKDKGTVVPPQPQAARPSVPAVAPPIAPRPRTEEDDFRDWALQMQNAVAKGDRTCLLNGVDWLALGLKVAPRKESSPLVTPMLEGMREGARKLGELLCAEVTKGGQYKLISVRLQGGQWKALFRLVAKNGAFNYHDFFLVRGKDGKIMASDLYIAMSGEAYSETLARITRFLLLERQRPSKEVRARAECFTRHSRLTQIGKHEEAMRVLDEVPKRYQHEKWVLIARITKHEGQNDAAYGRLVEEAQKYYPGDPCFDLLSLTYWLNQKNFDRALASIRRLGAFVEGDPFRDMLEAKLLCSKGDLPAASAMIQKAIAKEPDSKGAYWTKIEIDLGLLDFSAVANALLLLEKKLGERLPILETIEPFSLFVKSEQYGLWQKARISGELAIPVVAQ